MAEVVYLFEEKKLFILFYLFFIIIQPNVFSHEYDSINDMHIFKINYDCFP